MDSRLITPINTDSGRRCLPFMKYCRKCKTDKPEAEFYFDNSRNAVSAPCKECRIALVTELSKGWKKSNPDKVKQSGRRTKLKKLYGLSPETLSEIWIAQNKSCKICKRPLSLSATEKSSKPHVDHDHVSGVVRGLLCLTCNTGLGMFGDSAGLLEAAKQYLLLTRGTSTLNPSSDTASVSAANLNVH